MVQLVAVLEGLAAKSDKAALGRQIIVVTEATDNPLRRLASRLGGTILEQTATPAGC